MESIASEFAKFFFQPPVLILFALAVVGASDLVARRRDYRFRTDMEWRARESWMRGWMKEPNEELIERSRRQFYERKFLKMPKRKRTF